MTASRDDHLIQVAVGGAALDALGGRGFHPFPGGFGGRFVALHHQDVGAVDQEGVGDPGAHAAAAEDADGGGKVRGCVMVMVLSLSPCRSWFLACFLVEESLHAVKLGLGFKEDPLRQLVDQRVGLRRGVEHGLGDPDGQRVLPADPVRQVVRGIHQVRRLVDFGDEAGGQGLLGPEHQARQQDLLGQRLPHQLLQPPAGPGRGQDPQPCFRVADPDTGRSDPEVGGVGELRAAAQAVAVQGGDDRHGQLGDPDENGGVDALQGIVAAPLAQLGDVRAGGEDAVDPGDDQDLGALLQRGADDVQFVHHLLVDGVPDLRAVEEHHHAVLALLNQERAEVAQVLSVRSRPGRPLDALQQHRGALAHADAHGGQADPGVLAFHPAQQGDGDP